MFRIAFTALAWMVAVAAASGQLQLGPLQLRNHPSIAYPTAPTTDPLARMNERIRRGEVRFQPEPTSGYLRSVLAALDVPVESQILVFSKTSFQAPRIRPGNPRAIYFNDEVSVGWVRGGEVLEFAVQDPKQGTVFYTLDQPPSTPLGTVALAEVPEFRRNNVNCIQCHTSDATLNVPGMFIGSVYPEKDGTTAYGPAYTTDHRTPFELRWGGWYVTGRHTGTRHMGNAIALDRVNLDSMITPATVHVSSLAGRFDPAGYLSTHSDLVALLVIEHQARMLNLFTRVGWEARMGTDAGRPLEHAVAELVDYMLFIDEAALPGPIAGTSDYAAVFQSRGPRDRRGRSLRDLDLGQRMFKYRCSFLIYSPAFDGMPAEAKAMVYARLWDVLSGADRDERYAVLPAAERQAIVEILRDTKPGLPAYFTNESTSP